MDKYTGSQYDDDLTVGMDEYDDSLQTGSVDLFEFVNDEESPITRLKTIILSIDWEITDEILRQFNIELLDLKDIWAHDKINLVYVQLLEKLSKYIYKEKANANPNAIKLLLHFYADLEKIVSTESMSETEKKGLLMVDVEKFEKFKKQISRTSQTVPKEKIESTASIPAAPVIRVDEPSPMENGENPLLNLKALVFGMDWEITEKDLINLGEEVRRLEKRYSNSKAKLIFLQGIGALGAYINLKRSNAHADAFKLLHSFFLSLETVVGDNLTGEEEKQVLMPEVEKFNAFKTVIASTISPDAIAAEKDDLEDQETEDSEEYISADGNIAPAFADMPEDIHGFQEEEEARALGFTSKQKVEGQIEKFFEEDITGSTVSVAGEDAEIDPSQKKLLSEMESRLDTFFGEEKTLQSDMRTSKEIALEGVNVETEADDDAGEEALLRFGDELAPALSENIEGEVPEEPFPAEIAGIDESGREVEDSGIEKEIASPVAEDVLTVLEGVNVETEADDDSDEVPLPRSGAELAPALFSLEGDEDGLAVEHSQEDQTISGIEKRLDDFFGEEPELVSEEEALRSTISIEEREGPTESSIQNVFDLAEAEEEGGELFAAEAPKVDQGPVSESDEQQRVERLDFSSEISSEADLESHEIETTEEIEFQVEDQMLSFEESEPIATLSDEVEEVLSFGEEELAPPANLDEIESGASGSNLEIDIVFPEGEETLLLEIEEKCEPVAVLSDEAEEELSFEEDGFTTSEATEESEPIATLSGDDEDVLTFAEDELVSSTTVEESEPTEAVSEDSEEAFSVEEKVSPSPVSFEETGAVEVQDELRSLEGDKEESSEDHLKEFFEIESEELEKPVEALEPKEELEVEFSGIGTEFIDETKTQVLDVLSPVESETELEFEESQDVVFKADSEDSAASVSVLQEDEDFIEYIEGIEFDSEEESLENVFEQPESTEEVIFEAVEDEEVAGVSPEQELFGEAKEEFDEYFAELEELTKNVDKVELSETTKESERFAFDGFDKVSPDEKSEIGSEIHMEVIPETGKETRFDFEESKVLFAQNGGLPETRDVWSEDAEVLDEGLSSGKEEETIAQLRNCVASLGLEINDSAITNLVNEIERIRNLPETRSVEKIFLQLLLTVAQHIDQYRHQSSPESYTLLMSVFDKLEICKLAGVESVEVQEGLLSETSKILLWQQRMLERKVSEEAAPTRPQDDDFTRLEERKGYGTLYTSEQDDDLSQGKEKEFVSASPSADGNDALVKPPEKVLNEERISKIVRNEMETMRQAFREELADLLRQHFQK